MLAWEQVPSPRLTLTKDSKAFDLDLEGQGNMGGLVSKIVQVVF